MSDPASGRPPVGHDERVRMDLYSRVVAQSLEEDYAVVARRRGAGTTAAPERSSSALLLVTLVIGAFGLLVATSFVQTNRSQDVDDASRETLVSRINAERAQLADRQGQLAQLQDENAEVEAALPDISAEEQAAATRVRRLQVRTGFTPVRGPGVRVTVSERPDADDNGVVQDSDLSLLANALWTAGAEALAVNGHRITVRSEIRESGLAIHVNDVGIAPPYTVLAIGDNRTLQSRFYASSSGTRFDALADFFGFDYTIDNVDSLVLPSAPNELRRLGSVSTELTETPPGTESPR